MRDVVNGIFWPFHFGRVNRFYAKQHKMYGPIGWWIVECGPLFTRCKKWRANKKLVHRSQRAVWAGIQMTDIELSGVGFSLQTIVVRVI